MNPWKIIGWIVLVALVLLLAMCSLAFYGASRMSSEEKTTHSAPRGSPAPAPSYSAEVVAVECMERGPRDKAKVTIRNTGMQTIPNAKAFFQFMSRSGEVVSADDSYFSPIDIPPGATASADTYSNGGDAASCTVSAVQDGAGAPVTLTTR